MWTGVYSQPMSVAVDASSTVFKQFSSGYITTGCTTNVNHAVNAVGYTSTYWIVRNSWGSTWGIGGYVYIGYDSTTATTSTVGIGGINQYVMYPDVY